MSAIAIVDVITLKLWLDKSDSIIIDVREPYEYKEGYINGAINIPLSNILAGIEQIKDIHFKKIVLQCRSGVRSMRACQLLQDDGFAHDVWNLEGGIIAWQEMGFKLHTES